MKNTWAKTWGFPSISIVIFCFGNLSAYILVHFFNYVRLTLVTNVKQMNSHINSVFFIHFCILIYLYSFDPQFLRNITQLVKQTINSSIYLFMYKKFRSANS